jgi:hypothetical protein
MPDSIWQLIYQIGLVFLVPIAGALASLIIQQIQEIKLKSLKIVENTWEKTKLIVKSAVESSEQQYKAGMITDRKAHALEVSKRMLKDRKIKFDETLLSELIEAQVWNSFNSPAIKKTDVLILPEAQSPPVPPQESNML